MPKLSRREFTGSMFAGVLGAAPAITATAADAAASPVAILPAREILSLWPQGAPGLPAQPPVEALIERSTDASYHDRALTGVREPRMVVFRPARPNGAAVLVTPGGGYRWVVVDKEGFEMGQWFAERGYTAFVLFYRLPGDGWAAGPDTPLSDAQRAMRLIRRNAERFHIDPQRVAALGFSAGGHVSADLGTRFAVATYKAVDDADSLSARPWCMAPLYPVISMSPTHAHAYSRNQLLGATPTPEAEAAHSPDRNVGADTPAAFLLHASDDDVVPVANTLLLDAALRARGIETELHVFSHGGHGFGLRRAQGKPIEIWPQLFEAWAVARGWRPS